MAQTHPAKIIVIIMTVMIVAMSGLLVWGLTRPVELTPTAPTAQLPANVTLAARGKIISISQAGPYLAVLMEKDDNRQILLVSPLTGKIVSVLQTGAE